MSPESWQPPTELPAFLEWVVNSGILCAEMVDISAKGANESELVAAQFPSELTELLRQRDGWNLDEIRIHGLSHPHFPIRRTRSGLVFASDYSGFWYEIRGTGIFSVDHDGGEEKLVATDVNDFFRNYVFGVRAVEFAGEEWANEVSERIWRCKRPLRRSVS